MEGLSTFAPAAATRGSDQLQSCEEPPGSLKHPPQRHKGLSLGLVLLDSRHMRNHLLWVFLLLAFSAAAAERQFDFSAFPQNQTPPGFRSAVTGNGKPGDWKVIVDEAPTPASSPAAQAPGLKQAVLAQLAQDPTDEHFPLLIFEDKIFGDFAITTRFKTVRGVTEQMAGIAFRIQNETNYYVVRASSLGNSFRFYKVVDGERSTPIGPQIPIASGLWHELSVACKGNQIRCLLNGKEVIPPLQDSSFSSGKIRVLDQVRLSQLFHRHQDRLYAPGGAGAGAGA